MPKQKIADSRSTLQYLLDGAKRKGRAARIRTSFVQIRLPDGTSKPGPLRTIVKNHDAVALDLYLLLMALATSPPYDVTRDARYWARALDLVDDKGDHNTGAISKAWARLEKLGLVSRARKGNQASITPRPESGEAPPEEQYSPPEGGADDLYFRIPFDYWLADDPLHKRLEPREKAMLLICLSLLKKSEFKLTAENVERWYGVSEDTAQKALKGLVDKRVLIRRDAYRATASAPKGYTYDVYYRLTAPFARPRQASAPAKSGDSEASAQ
ncbi:hypothetical protein [Microbispora sp. KK1-11]|uniref:hypothetical protein n=1 Tax=Microbispora sp. KK1-11 TaxID=2053005 RepID=UPI00115A4BE5|nr:hypothetical protein [Microbispora sp. KK1-11]TQS19881.1 hypothetical protein FLW16_41415 [Microbispora sp. KK1-11]